MLKFGFDSFWFLTLKRVYFAFCNDREMQFIFIPFCYLGVSIGNGSNIIIETAVYYYHYSHLPNSNVLSIYRILVLYSMFMTIKLWLLNNSISSYIRFMLDINVQ